MISLINFWHLKVKQTNRILKTLMTMDYKNTTQMFSLVWFLIKRLLFRIIIVQMTSSSFNRSSPTVVIIAPWSIIVISPPLVPVTGVRVPSGCVELRGGRVHLPPLTLDRINHHRQ